MLPLGDQVFAGQVEQPAEPLADLNVPLAHGAHAVPFPPVYPGMHSQSFIDVLAPGDHALVGQLTHEGENP